MYSDDQIISKALSILAARIAVDGVVMSSPATVKEFLTVNLAELEHEVFAVLWLNTQNTLICYEELFRGTLTECSVFPREVAKIALHHNAGAAILIHNHPSQSVKPSEADKTITQVLSKALGLFDIRVLDHIIVGGLETFSFAENGLM